MHPPVLTPSARLALGILVVLSFECTTALFNSVHRRGEPIKWGLVSYTVVMFSLVTAGTGMNLDILSISYIDNRDFPGIEGVLRPGPYGYQAFISAEAINMIPTAILVLSNWLADGFLVGSLFDAVVTHRGI